MILEQHHAANSMMCREPIAPVDMRKSFAALTVLVV